MQTQSREIKTDTNVHTVKRKYESEYPMNMGRETNRVLDEIDETIDRINGLIKNPLRYYYQP